MGTHKAGWEPAAQRFSQGRPGITVYFWRGHRDPDRERARVRAARRNEIQPRKGRWARGSNLGY